MPSDDYDPIIAAIDDAPLEYDVAKAIALSLVAEIRRLAKANRVLVSLAEDVAGDDESCWQARAVKALEAYRGR